MKTCINIRVCKLSYKKNPETWAIITMRTLVPGLATLKPMKVLLFIELRPGREYVDCSLSLQLSVVN